jgi:hypothetical protein
MGIKTIIFSKNRAMQLEALLRSLSLNNVSVIYTHDEYFEDGYEKLMKMYSYIDFIKEVNFKDQVISLIDEYTLFLVDDEIMIRPFNDHCEEFNEFVDNVDILTLSLRMSKKYDYDFLKGISVNIPEFIGNKWEWRKHKHDWGYPMAATTHIFRGSDIFNILLNSKFSCPNTMEIAMRRNVPDKPYAMCCDNAVFINNLANRVQNKFNNKHGNVSLELLNDLFMDGKRIDIEDMKRKASLSHSSFMMEEYQYEV